MYTRQWTKYMYELMIYKRILNSNERWSFSCQFIKSYTLNMQLCSLFQNPSDRGLSVQNYILYPIPITAS